MHKVCALCACGGTQPVQKDKHVLLLGVCANLLVTTNPGGRRLKPAATTVSTAGGEQSLDTGRVSAVWTCRCRASALLSLDTGLCMSVGWLGHANMMHTSIFLYCYWLLPSSPQSLFISYVLAIPQSGMVHDA